MLSSCRHVRVWPFRIRKSKWTEFAADADNLNLREHIFEKRLVWGAYAYDYLQDVNVKAAGLSPFPEQ